MPTDSTGTRMRAMAASQAAPAAADVVEVHGLGRDQVGVGVEPAGQLLAVVVEVALDLEALPQARSRPSGGVVGHPRPKRSANTSSERKVTWASWRATASPPWGPSPGSAS